MALEFDPPKDRAAAAAPVPDESWLDRASALLLSCDGDCALLRLTGDDGRTFLAARTSWANDGRCRRMDHEFSLAPLMGEDWALVPAGLLRTREGPVLLYPDRGGQPLSALCRPPIALFLDIAAQAARALAEAHRRQLVHGDVQPRVLMLDPDGRVRLTAFRHGLPAGEHGRMPTAHTAPEAVGPEGQCGDERSDLYSLGITLFELLTGSLPLTATSTAEWLHAHMAVQPPPPSTLRADVPPLLDALILKLTAKAPDARYQSAATLADDLTRCLREWTAHQRIPAFELARRDRIRRLTPPDGIMGRQREQALLRMALDRASASTSDCASGSWAGEVVFIGGAPGSGKTALAVDVMRRGLPSGTTVATGKVDQYQLAIPYAPVVQALRGLAMSLVAGPSAELEEQRAALAGRLEAQLPLFLHLLPEFEPVMGPPSHRLDGSSSQQPLQVQRILIGALQAFAGPSTPALLFLDDVQWADDATLAFVCAVAEARPPGLMLVAAYRDNLADMPPRFRTFLADLREGAGPAKQPATWIDLLPIDRDATAALVAAVLSEPVERSADLADAILEKSGGNPLHILQLLRTLVDEQVLRYDRDRSIWSWDPGGVAQRRGSDTVVDLLIARLHRLPADSREALRLLACVGGGADETLLAVVAVLPDGAVQPALAAAGAAGLVVRGDTGVWTFVHDRVQEATYSLTPNDARPALHAAIASSMLTLWPERRPDEVFRIAAQIELSMGAPLTRDQADAYALVLVDAAEHAVAAAARDRALTYLAGADRILGEERWTESYPTAWRSAVLATECLLATGDTARAGRAIDGLFDHAAGAIDKAGAHRLKAALLTVASDFCNAVRVALDGLRLLGIDLPTDPPPEALDATYQSIKRGLNGRPVASLVDLPPMDDPRIEAAMALLTALEAAFFYPATNLLHLHFAVMVDLTLKHGVTAASAQGMAWFGVSLATVYDKYEEGFAFASTALALVNRNGFERYRTPTLVALDQVSPWTQPLSYALARAREAKEAGNQSAELRMLCYSCNHIVSDLLAMGEPLPLVREETDPLLAIARNAGFDDIVDLVTAQREYVLSMQEGPQHAVGSWEAAFLAPVAAPSRMPMMALYFWTYVLRGQAALHHRDMAAARTSFAAATTMIWAAPAHIAVAELAFYSALLHTQDPGQDPGQDPAGGETARAEVERCRRRLALWADQNPLTFRNKLALVDAETARLDGDAVRAMKLYDEAAAAATAAGFPHEQALAHELAGRHALALDLGYVARDQLRLAAAGYRRWGALAKVRGLEAEFPFLIVDAPGGEPTPQRRLEDLDLELVLTTAHALSEEIVLDRLVERLMVNMIIHAGARRGSLLLVRDGEPRVAATAAVVNSDIVVRLDGGMQDGDRPADALVPPCILHTVLRTRRAMTSGDARAEGGFRPPAGAAGAVPAGSFLCQPLIKQGRLVGVLYLENDLAPDVFTPRKAAMMEVLAPQAANALEAARLYTDLMAENRRRQETETALRAARADLARVSHMTVLTELAASIAHEINQPLAGIVSSAGAGLRWLKAPEPDMAEALSNLENIRAAGLRVADILRALRALAKQAPLALEPLLIDPLVEDVLTLTGDEIGKKGVHLTARLDTGGVRVLGDRTQLQQVVLNLVTNALDAMAGANGGRNLRIESRVQGDTVAVSVVDSGGGIAPDILARIFDPFFTTKESGMGMGLSICRSIITVHGGTLRAEPAAGGSRFTFTLPTTAQKATAWA